MNNNLAAFDIDGTLISSQSQRLLLAYLFRRHEISFLKYILIAIWYILYKLGIVSHVRNISRYAFSYLKGKTDKELDPIFDDFFRRDCLPSICRNSTTLIASLRRLGYKIVFVSNAIDPIVLRFSKYLGADEYICTHLSKHDGVYDGDIMGESMYGPVKESVLREYAHHNGLSLKDSYAFSDHMSDLPFLQAVGRPVAVNPQKSLLSYSKENNIPVLYLNDDESFQYFKSHSLS